jgi:two-component system invasion response regulator UvrY
MKHKSEEKNMVKILVADDHAIVREGLKQVLAGTRDMTVAGEAANGNELLEKIRASHWDVVLLDLNMPDRSGLDTLKQLKNERPRLPVLILSMYPEEYYALRVLKAGASGYLTKESAPDCLVAAIRKVSAGGKYISASLAERLAFEFETDFDGPLHRTLSDREYQVLCLIAAGHSIKEIAQRLALSVKSISTYRARILQKMKMKSNAGLIHYAIQNHLLD